QIYVLGCPVRAGHAVHSPSTAPARQIVCADASASGRYRAEISVRGHLCAYRVIDRVRLRSDGTEAVHVTVEHAERARDQYGVVDRLVVGPGRSRRTDQVVGHVMSTAGDRFGQVEERPKPGIRALATLRRHRTVRIEVVDRGGMRPRAELTVVQLRHVRSDPL